MNRRHVDELFEDLVELDETERQARLDRLRDVDASVIVELKRLLARVDDTRPLLLDGDVALLMRSSGVDGALEKGTRVDRFLIESLIGKGGMGEVYEAVEDHPARRVALKVVRPELLSERHFRLLADECQTLAGLRHPGIAQVYAGGTAQVGGASFAYFAMELIEGAPLDQDVAARGLARRAILDLVARVCDAVQHAHQNAVIHCDLKPLNILVDKSGDPKVLDFGIARHLGPPAEDAGGGSGSRGGEIGVRGTPEYMAPEQLAGDARVIDTRTDVYALGVILHLVSFGYLPGGRATAAAAPANDLSRSESRELTMIVARATAATREERYQSASALAEDLRGLLAKRPIAAHPPSTWYTLRKLTSRRRAATILTAAALLMVMASWAATSVLYLSEAEQRRQADVRFDQVRELGKTLIFDIYDGVGNVPEATPLKELIARASQTHLDALAREAGDNEALMMDLSNSYERLGNVQGNPSYPNLGKIEEAEASYLKALELRKKALAGAPTDPWRRHGVALAMRKLSDIQRATGRTTRAIESLEECAALLDALHRESPEDLKVVLDLADAKRTLGLLLGITNRLKGDDGAIRLLEEVQELEKGVVARRPDDPEVRSRVANTHEYLGDFVGNPEYPNDGRPAEAMALYETSMIIRTDLASRPGAPPKDVEDLAILEMKMATMSRRLDRPEKTLAHAREAVSLWSRLAGSDVKNMRYQHGLGYGQQTMGDALNYAGRPREAVAALRESKAAFERVLKVSPGHTDVEGSLAATHMIMGDVLRTGGRDEEAGNEYATATATLRGMLQRGVDDPQTTFQLGSGLAAMGDVMTVRGRFVEAETIYGEACEQLRRQDAADDFQGGLKWGETCVSRGAALLCAAPAGAASDDAGGAMHWLKEGRRALSALEARGGDVGHVAAARNMADLAIELASSTTVEAKRIAASAYAKETVRLGQQLIESHQYMAAADLLSRCSAIIAALAGDGPEKQSVDDLLETLNARRQAAWEVPSQSPWPG